MRVKWYDKEQADLVEMQAVADSAEDNTFDLVKALLFSGDYRIEGGDINEDSPVSGVVKVNPGIFVKADGKFYTMPTTATANILTGTEDQAANVWGTGQAADPTNPRKDIIVVNFQFLEEGSAVKDFVDDSVDPPVFYSQTVNTRKYPAPTFSILHGTPSATPSEPAVPSGFLKLATIYVAAAVTTIADADITNNLNINLKTLEKIQLASQAQSAFSDRLHSDGVYENVNSELEVTETSPQSMGVSVSTGVALKDGTTANINTQTTVPVDAASFVNKPAEVVSFASGDTQPLQCDGTPPHKIRAGTYLVTGPGGTPSYTDVSDYTIDLVNATITRVGGGTIPAGTSVEVTYDYYLPRIDVVEVLMSNSTPQIVKGTPAHTPVAPSPSPNAMELAEAYVGEGVTVIVDANITDKRIFLPDLDELVASRGGYATVPARLSANDVAVGNNATAISNHVADNVTPSNTVHGIQQGSGNGFDADKLDSQEGTFYIARANHTGVQAPATISPQGSGSGLNADQVDNYNASATPTANTLCPLDGGAQFPTSTIPTSALLPPGLIMAYGGVVTPSGWADCFGSSQLRTDPIYAALFGAVGTRWGAIDGTHFNLPDFRGVTLRGENGAAIDSFADPDAGSRIARHTGGQTGNNVGSYQQDEVVAHTHTYSQAITQYGYQAGANNPLTSNTVTNTGSTGGNETRMKNAYVRYIIKL